MALLRIGWRYTVAIVSMHLTVPMSGISRVTVLQGVLIVSSKKDSVDDPSNTVHCSEL